MKLVIATMLSIYVLFPLNTLAQAPPHRDPASSQRGLHGGSRPYVVKNWQQSNSRIAWRVFVEDDDPDVRDAEEQTIEVVSVEDYGTLDTPIYLASDSSYCLRVLKGPEEDGFGLGTNHIEIQDPEHNHRTIASIYVEQQGQKHQCFRTPPLVREMCIYTEKAEGPDGHFIPSALVKDSGHAAVALVYQQTWEDKAWIKTYGKWNEGRNIQTQYCQDWPYNSRRSYNYVYCQPITYNQWAQAEEYAEQLQQSDDGEYKLWNNCATFASEMFLRVVAEDVDANDVVFGIATPHELGKSIIEKNGGVSGEFPVEALYKKCYQRRNLLRGRAE